MIFLLIAFWSSLYLFASNIIDHWLMNFLFLTILSYQVFRYTDLKKTKMEKKQAVNLKKSEEEAKGENKLLEFCDCLDCLDIDCLDMDCLDLDIIDIDCIDCDCVDCDCGGIDACDCGGIDCL